MCLSGTRGHSVLARCLSDAAQLRHMRESELPEHTTHMYGYFILSEAHQLLIMFRVESEG